MMTKPVCCECRTIIVDEPEDVSDFVSVARGRYACQPCADDIVQAAHESIWDDDPEGDGPCRCLRCLRSRDAADAIRRTAYAAAVGGLSVEGLRLVGLDKEIV